MRVLIVIDDLRRAGAQRVVMQEIRALHPHAVEFHVVTLARAPEPSFEGEILRLGVRLQHLPGSGMIDPRRAIALSRLIGHLDPDLVHTHLTYSNVLGTLAAAVARRPAIASLHNMDTNQLRWPTAKRWLEGFVLRNWAACSVLVSAGAREPTSVHFRLRPERTVVIANAVDPRTIQLPDTFERSQKRQALSVRPDERLICNVARLEPSKGHRFLMQALALLCTRVPDYPLRLVLVGGGSEADRIAALTRRLGVADRVAMLGIREDASQIIAASDLFVQASLNEGLSQALLEAMALATPVVATNVGGTSDVVQPGRTGWRVVPGHAVALANAIQQALAAPAQAAAYARAARTLVTQGFSLQLHVLQLQTLYQSMAIG